MGSCVGANEGWVEGLEVGDIVLDGLEVGFALGTDVGEKDFVGNSVGAFDGILVGSNEGLVVGLYVGSPVGANEG